MQNKFKISLWCLSILIVLTSCSSESNYLKSEPSNIEAIAQWAPFYVSEKGDKATIGFVQTPIPFEMNRANGSHQSDMDLIKNAIGKDIPLRIFVYKGTSKIAKIEAVSNQEIAKYRSQLIRSTENLPNRPDPDLISIFPDEASLLTVFNSILANSCTNNNNQQGCVTFQFASDGCNARAHKMKQILNANGYSCQKHYIFGDLLASAGSCCISWVYHTAPLVLVHVNGTIEERILDPSLFNTPVAPEVWRAGCQNSVCVFNPDFEFQPTVHETVPGIVFNYDLISKSFLLDSDYFRTDCTLDVYQTESGCGMPSQFPPANCQN